MIPPLALTGRHFSGPTSDPSSVIVVLDELIGASNVTSLELLGHSRRHAYTDRLSFDDVYLSYEK